MSDPVYQVIVSIDPHERVEAHKAEVRLIDGDRWQTSLYGDTEEAALTKAEKWIRAEVSRSLGVVEYLYDGAGRPVGEPQSLKA